MHCNQGTKKRLFLLKGIVAKKLAATWLSQPHSYKEERKGFCNLPWGCYGSLEGLMSSWPPLQSCPLLQVAVKRKRNSDSLRKTRSIFSLFTAVWRTGLQTSQTLCRANSMPGGISPILSSAKTQSFSNSVCLKLRISHFLPRQGLVTSAGLRNAFGGNCSTAPIAFKSFRLSLFLLNMGPRDPHLVKSADLKSMDN